jgi:hypothetical protein
MKQSRNPCPPVGRRPPRRAAIVAVTLLLAAAAAYANSPATPTGPVLLTVEGRLDATSREISVAFDEAMLAALPEHRIETSTPWTDGNKVFEGVLLADLFASIGIDAARSFRAVALNAYEIVTPVDEALSYGALLAMRMDGVPLTRRDKGPIWMVYPRDGNPKIQDERYDARWVWQLTRIEVR